jgi:2-polyprenyl-3-methyl-5-hydroxy-6-metoxy-1,4-benzoquinol methylase
MIGGVKYGVIPTNLSERMALAFGKIPIPLLDSLYGILKARTLMAGVRLGVFEALGTGPQKSSDLASRLKLDERFLDLLLRNLVLAGYLVQKDGIYKLSKLGRCTMVPGGDMEMFGYVLWNYQQWEMVAGLDEAVRCGHGLDFHSNLKDPVAWSNYQRGMLELARLEACMLARKVPVPRGARNLLDVAGSHGLFGAAICRKHPPMRSTVLELPEALPEARSLAASEGINGIVEHRAGRLLEGGWGAGYDVVLLFNILHHFSPEQVESILRYAASALRSKGVVAVWELESPLPGSKVTVGDGAALYFALTSTGGAYHAEQYSSWLCSAGFESLRFTRRKLTPGKILVTAVAR